MAGTLLRLGWTDPRTGLFGAHPQLGGPLDLNDGVTFTLLDDELEIAPPPRELALSGSARAAGERGLRALYRHNRRVSARLILGPMASYADLSGAIRALAAWPRVAPSPGVVAALLALDPTATPAPEPLILTGAQHGGLRDTLDAFARQRDQTLNRVAPPRRPPASGGIVRKARAGGARAGEPAPKGLAAAKATFVAWYATGGVGSPRATTTPANHPPPRHKD